MKLSLVLAAGLVLVAAAVGYALGRRAGAAQGAARARAEVPLEQRADLLEAGRCPVCGRDAVTGAAARSSASGG